MVSKLTVITVCLNSAKTIDLAIQSVAAQNAPDIDHLIVDGGSRDGTLEILAQYPHLKVISEPDTGLYDAMNKGMLGAQGEYVMFLNSDDRLATDLWLKALPCMQGRPDVICFGADFRRARPGGEYDVLEIIADLPSIALTPQNATLGSPLLNAKIFSRAFLRDRVGQFDLTYNIASDVEFLWRAAIAGPRTQMLSHIGYHYLQHEGSLTINPDNSNGVAAARECVSIAQSLLQQTTEKPGLRGVLRALRGGKYLVLIKLDARSRLAIIRPRVLGDILFYLTYLVNRKLRIWRGRTARFLAP